MATYIEITSPHAEAYQERKDVIGIPFAAAEARMSDRVSVLRSQGYIVNKWEDLAICRDPNSSMDIFITINRNGPDTGEAIRWPGDEEFTPTGQPPMCIDCGEKAAVDDGRCRECAEAIAEIYATICHDCENAPATIGNRCAECADAAAAEAEAEADAEFFNAHGIWPDRIADETPVFEDWISEDMWGDC